VQKLSCPRGGVTHLTFSPDGDLLAGIGAIGTRFSHMSPPTAVYCWTRSRDWEKTGLEHDGPVTGVAFHPTGRTLAYAGIARLGVAQAAPPPPPAGGPAPSIWRRRFAREALRPFTGVHLYSLTGTDEFVPNRVRVPQDEVTILSPDSWARGLVFTPDGRVLLSAHSERTGFSRTRANVYHWHFTEGEGVWRVADVVAAHGATERGGALVGASYLALAGQWGVAVCPVESPTGLYVPDVQSAGVVAVASGSELVAVREQGPLVVWHLRTAEPVARAKADPGAVTALAFAPDGATLAVGTAGKIVTFWNPLTGAYGPERDFDVGPVTALAYAPDGLTLAVAGRTGLVVVDTE
jgi:WD40 repeat protein